MKKKTEKTIETEKVKKILIDAIEKKVALRKEYRETPTRTHLEKIVNELELSDDSAVMLVAFNKEKQSLCMKGIKAKTCDLYAMACYALAKVSEYDIASVLDSVSTLARQEELNKFWIDGHEEAAEIKDDDK